MRFAPLRSFLFVILFSLGAAGCSSSGVALPESELLRVFERKAGQIAYLGMDGNIYTTDQAGTEHIQITNDTEGIPIELVVDNRYFAWSPTADRLAHIGYTQEMWTVQVSSPDGAETTQVFSDNASLPIHLQWTPSGERVTLLTIADLMSTEGVPQFTLQSLEPAGSGPEALLGSGRQLFFSLEPVGDRAVAHITGGTAEAPESRLAILTAGADFERSLELPPANFQAPAWSPDGTQLLMAIEDVQGRNALVTVNLQGQVRQTLTTFDEAIAFSFSPDGRQVGYITGPSLRQGTSGVLTVVNATTGEEMFVSEEVLVHAFFWSPDGDQIVYFTQELIGSENETNPVFGFGLHFIDTRSWEVRHYRIGENLFAFQPTPQFRGYLQAFDQFSQGTTIWSPDGENIVIPALTQVQGGVQGVILVIPADGGLEPRQLAQGLLALWSPE